MQSSGLRPIEMRRELTDFRFLEPSQLDGGHRFL